MPDRMVAAARLRLEAEHGADAALDPAVILLDPAYSSVEGRLV